MSDAVPAAADSAEQEKEQAKVAEGAKQVKEMSEAMKRLLEPSQRQKGNALKVAEISIGMLDKMVGHLREQRRYAAQVVTDSKKEIVELDGEIAFIQKKLDSVEEVNKARTQQYQGTVKLHDECAEQFRDLLKETKQRVAITQKKQKQLGQYEIPLGRPNYLSSGKKKQPSRAASTTPTAAAPAAAAPDPARVGTGGDVPS